MQARSGICNLGVTMWCLMNGWLDPRYLGNWRIQFQPSLRDALILRASPGVETPGYCRSSLRDGSAGEGTQ